MLFVPTRDKSGDINGGQNRLPTLQLNDNNPTTVSKLLPVQTYLHSLKCPYTDRGVLAVQGDKVRCQDCGREFRIGEEGILDFIVPSELDAETARELKGHTYTLSQQQVENLVRKEKDSLWKSYYSCNRMKTMQHLAAFLNRVNCRKVFFLGVGTGREIEYLLSFCKLDTVICSDLSYTSLRIIPTRLAPYGLNIGLFTSDLQNCPVESKDVPIIIVNALHHTQDMHVVIETLLNNQYHNIFLIEPTNNFVIRFFTKLGLARRKEYSGVIPGRLEILRLKALCRKYHYQCALKTHWSFPQDYYKKIFTDSGHVQRGFFWLLNGFSRLTNLAQFGNFSIVHMQKLKL